MIRDSRPLAFAILAALLLPRPTPAALSDATWPQKQDTSQGTLVLYRPVIESWDDQQRLVVRQASSFLRRGEDHRHFGIARISIQTTVDSGRGEVTLGERSLLGLDVPSLNGEALERVADWRQEQLSQKSATVPVAQLLTWVDRDRAITPETEVVHPRPRVFLRTRPAQLVLLDGPPTWYQTQVDDVAILANSDTLIVRAARRFYLHAARGWVESSSLAGPWVPRQGWPTPLLELPRSGAPGRLRELFREGPSDPAPEVIVSHHEVELVQLDGPPRLEPIPGTQLRYVTNTDADLFTHPSRAGYFLLVSGRWFHIEGENDLGEYVSRRLPEDFRRIPADHPRAHVLASVPGTPEAEDAVIAAGVPRFRTVAPGQVTFATRFEGGPPRWRRITGTDLDEATNTSQDVLRRGSRWLGCDRGVWFESRNEGRTWTLLRELPAEIAGIPPESSKHRLSYIDLVPLEDGRVRAAVRGGYFGTYAAGGVVVHGTGHEYEHTQAFYLDALDRIRRYYEADGEDPLAAARPSLLEPFYIRTYGYGFHYDPAQVLFRPTRTRFLATRAPRPQKVAATQLTREELAGKTIYPGADGRLYRRSDASGWERLGPAGWTRSEAPPRSRSTTAPARLGKLPEATQRERPEGPVRIGAARAEAQESTGDGEADKPSPGRIGGLKPPKIKQGYDAYRWTNQFAAPPPPRVIPSYPPIGYYPQYPTQYRIGP